MDLNFRPLEAEEIDCRVNSISEKGLTLLLYKDARVDQNILDETVGALNWKREHTRDNANCIVSIWDKDKEQWISKEDTGTESYTEKEKGLASDSFKRACVNWGIGRELYSAPFIYVFANMANIKKGNNGKLQCNDKFVVGYIKYDEKRTITALSIINQRTGDTVFTTGNPFDNKASMSGMIDYIKKLITDTSSDTVKLCDYFKVKAVDDLQPEQARKCISMLESKLK